jgi:hypothetical protein
MRLPLNLRNVGGGVLFIPPQLLIKKFATFKNSARIKNIRKNNNKYMYQFTGKYVNSMSGVIEESGFKWSHCKVSDGISPIKFETLEFDTDELNSKFKYGQDVIVTFELRSKSKGDALVVMTKIEPVKT